MPGHPEVKQIITEIAELQARLQSAFDAGDTGAAERLMAELSAAERRRNRAMQRAMAGDTTTYHATLPVREQVARVLATVVRPTAVSLIRDVAAARFGDSISGPRLASLRRDEHRSWRAANSADSQRAASRPVYVVPALTYDRLAPVRGLLALSSWPLELRLIAPGSHRVDALHVADRLADELAATPAADWAPEVERVLWRLAATVPGATSSGATSSGATSSGTGGLDTTRVRRAVAAELAQLADADAAERAHAAQRARSQLDEEQQLYGSRMTVISGGRAAEAEA